MSLSAHDSRQLQGLAFVTQDGLPLDTRVAAVLALQKAHLAQEFSVEDLARYVNLSPSRLRALFRRTLGISLAHSLKLLRLKAAHRLLRQEFLTVQEAMERVGLHDASHFTRDFKHLYGITPGQLRSKERERNSRFLRED